VPWAVRVEMVAFAGGARRCSGATRPVQGQRQISVVDHIQPGVQEPVDRAGTTHLQWRLLQPDPVGAGAGRYTDERELDHPVSLLAIQARAAA
jgi:hypothetical protein